MLTPADYQSVKVEGWRLSVLAQFWSTSFEKQVLGLVARQNVARHPQTFQLRCEISAQEKVFFVKVFHRRGNLAALKDSLRPTKAVRFWRQGLALSASGFKAPLTVAVGMERGWSIAKREFVVTETVGGVSLAQFLRDPNLGKVVTLSDKRKSIEHLAKLIRQFHDRGFVHGDLVATNILVARDNAGEIEFYFMDNDRTKRYPSWLPQKLWRRNLIQLNRMPLALISLQDRMRFLHAYFDVSSLGITECRFARWLEARTRQRRKECDGADPNQNFRKLMRWVAETPEIKALNQT